MPPHCSCIAHCTQVADALHSWHHGWNCCCEREHAKVFGTSCSAQCAAQVQGVSNGRSPANAELALLCLVLQMPPNVIDDNRLHSAIEQSHAWCASNRLPRARNVLWPITQVEATAALHHSAAHHVGQRWAGALLLVIVLLHRWWWRRRWHIGALLLVVVFLHRWWWRRRRRHVGALLLAIVLGCALVVPLVDNLALSAMRALVAGGATIFAAALLVQRALHTSCRRIARMSSWLELLV